MKHIFILSFLISLNAYSQCPFNVSFDEESIKKMYCINDEVNITGIISNSSTIRLKEVNIAQVCGVIPRSFTKYTNPAGTEISFDLKKCDLSNKQFLLIQYTYTQTVNNIVEKCNDTVFLNTCIGKQNEFWTKGVKIDINLKIDDKKINLNETEITKNRLDSIKGNTIYVSQSELGAIIKYQKDSISLDFNIFRTLETNSESMNVTVFINGMNDLKKFGITRMPQIKNLDKKTKSRIVKEFPEYGFLFNENIKEYMKRMYDTNHIVHIDYQLVNGQTEHWVTTLK